MHLPLSTDLGTVTPLSSETGLRLERGAISEQNDRPWHVCMTKPRQEAFAEAKLREQGYQVYLPLLEFWIRRAGVWSKTQTVMFPRYAFVRPGDPEQPIGPVRNTPGVSRLVHFGNLLAVLSADRLMALREVVAKHASSIPDQPIAPGERVMFSSGPLAGLNGVVSSIAANRVMVMMSLLGRDKIVSVVVDDLSRAL